MFLTYNIIIMFLTYKRHKYEFSGFTIKKGGAEKTPLSFSF